VSTARGAESDNVLVISGQVVGAPEVRISPAGIPISRFVLAHHSRQPEAGLGREVRCRIRVTAAGPELREQLQGLQAGHRVRVTGFVARAGYRSADWQLVLHAQSIEHLDQAER